MQPVERAELVVQVVYWSDIVVASAQPAWCSAGIVQGPELVAVVVVVELPAPVVSPPESYRHR